MMQSLLNQIKAHVAGMIGQLPHPRIGVVKAVDNARHLVKVELQPEGVLTGWVPVTAGWSMLELPAPGQQVLTIPQEGDAEALHVVGRVFAHAGGDAPAMAPTGFKGKGDNSGNDPSHVVPGKEFLLRNDAGAVFRVCADGSIYTHGPLRIDGDLTVNGNVSDMHGSLDRLRQFANSHAHGGVQTGSGQTGRPTSTDPE